MAMDPEVLMRLQVNQDTWQPNAYLFTKRRYFQRPSDGRVYPIPESEDWHILRLRMSGWQEVSGPEAEPETLRAQIKAQQEALAAAIAAKAATPDARDEQIRLLIASVEQQAKLIELLMKQQKEPGDGTKTRHAADH